MTIVYRLRLVDYALWLIFLRIEVLKKPWCDAPLSDSKFDIKKIGELRVLFGLCIDLFSFFDTIARAYLIYSNSF